MSLGFKFDSLRTNIRIGFVMSDGTNDISVFDGQKFLKVAEIRSDDYDNTNNNRHFHKLAIKNLIADQNLIDYYNIMWGLPFYYRNLNT